MTQWSLERHNPSQDTEKKKKHFQAVRLNYMHLNKYWTELKLIFTNPSIFYLKPLQRCSDPTCRLAEGETTIKEFQKLHNISRGAMTRTQDQHPVSLQLPITDHSVAGPPSLPHPAVLTLI